MRRPALLIAVVGAFGLSACAPRVETASSIAPPQRPRSEWAMGWSDVPVDPAFRFGRLANGMRFAIRQNATPKGTALVRMEVSAGSLDERDDERGFAHFVEHMSFNGSTRVAEGEMVKLLERNGLAFGADTNASTSFSETQYKLDLPRNDPQLLDTALMLMRETASELTFAPEAVAREKGVVLAEMRDRNTWQLRDYAAQISFGYPKARFTNRLPIGTLQSLQAADAAALKAFWRREYVPGNTTVIVVGDFDAAAVEAAIRTRFADWQAGTDKVEPQPDAGPVDPRDTGRTAVYIDPSLSERMTIARAAPWREETDSLAQRREDLLQGIGYAIINRRLVRLTREKNPPFRSAGFGTQNVFRAGTSTSLAIDTVDGRWRTGLLAAVAEYRRALAFGFTPAEVAEQVANLRSQSRNAAASQDTRSNANLVNAAVVLLRDQRVPSRPSDALERLEAIVPTITNDAVLAAVKRDLVTLDDPIIRFAGRRKPDGGEAAIRQAWQAAIAVQLRQGDAREQQTFAYTDFGPPGVVVSDSRSQPLGIRSLRFANGVRLNLKHSDIEKERVLVQFSLDGGDMLDTRDNPLATEMLSVMAAGGLGKHSQDELQTLLAGRTVSGGLSSTPETFVTVAGTTPSDLQLQLQLMAASITDPGFRPEAQTLFYNTINTYFTRLKATPRDALSNGQGAIISDNDPRFSLQPVAAYRALTFAKLKAALADRLANGAIEIGIVGDIDEDAAIAAVANTLGALPQREGDFRAYADQRQRSFTQDRSPRTLRHNGAADQAIVRLTWPTRDGEDPADSIALALLERVAQNLLTETIREKLGKAYSPSASSTASRVWPGWGTFSLTASVEAKELAAVRAAMVQAAALLRDAPITADQLDRARAPMFEQIDNALKSNRGWMELVDRAQTEPDRIDRQLKVRERLSAVTPALLQALAQRYLIPVAALEIDVLPEETTAAAN